jgi:superfamily II DNA or RNA helicase
LNQRSLYDDEVADYASVCFPPARPKQTEAHEKLRAGRRAGHRVQMVMAPTGSGKTYLALNAIQHALVKGYRALFVCDRTTLINQTSKAADKYGLKAHGIIQADNARTDASFPFQIASAQTLAARRNWPKADLIVIDEAQTQLKVWTEYVMKTEASVIGLSATPFSKGLGKIFSNLILAGTMAELTQSGVLVPLIVMRCTPVDMAGAATAGGEWTDKAAAERGMQIVGDVVVEWSKYADNRKTICFGATVAHCEELCSQFVKAGIRAALFTGHTTDDERKDLLEDFEKPNSTIRILISVEALAKGFDVPDVSCVIDCRPMRKALSTVIQMWGRGLRSCEGKEDCLLMDHSGNSIRFADDYERVFHEGLESLDAGEKLDSDIRKEPPIDQPKKGCPKCGFKPFARRCMGCGFEVEVASTVEHQPGTMEMVTLGKGKAIDKEALYNECVAYARIHSAPEKQLWRSRFLFEGMAGHRPPMSWNPDKVPHDAQVSKEVRNKIVSMNIKRAKTRVLAGAEA